MTLFLLIVFGIYFLLLLALIAGWEMTTKRKLKRKSTTHHSMTVIVPFRNEATHLPGIVADLISQNYFTSEFNVLFVDDHSTDNSVALLQAILHDKPNFKLLSLAADRNGKKRAIDCGVWEATGDLIVTTDADCTLPETWLSSIHLAFQNEKTQLVFGPVRIQADASVFSQLQSLEFSSLIGSGAATLRWGFPTMCNGANMAYRKSAYMEVGGFLGNFEVASGDDEFLMRKIYARYPAGVCFLNDQHAIVSTQAQPSVNDFVSQRLRWAGKWKYNKSVVSMSLALFVLLFHTTFVVLIGMTIAGKVTPNVAGALIGGKILLEFIFLARVNSFLNLAVQPIYFLMLQFVHPLYVIVVGFLSQIGSYSWKGRSLKI
jgi:biofilm PGA synthesis N-glycosyltransferase PgaC